MILGYSLIATLEMLKEWKVVITSVGQRYESIESQHNYKIDIGIKYGERDVFIDIRKAKDNFDKDERPKCFNCNIYRHIVKKC